MKMSVEEFEDLCRTIFRNHGFTDEEIVVCTEEIVEAQCRGRASHGAAIIPEVVEWKKEIPTGPIEVIRETPISAYVLGNNNMGPVVCKQAMDIAIKKAEATGIAIVGVNNKFPFILTGYNTRRATAKGLIGISWSVAFSKVAPFGSADAILGTNPLSIAIPKQNGSVVLDMAMTKVAAAEIRRCNKLGIPIPEGVAISKEGSPTTDPKEALQGAMLPFGDYKGSGLAIMIELLGGAFVGAKTGRVVPGNRGMVFVALRPDLFVSKEQFFNDVSRFISDIKNSRVRQGFKEVLLPGEKGDRLLEQAKKEGVEIEDKIYTELKQLAGRPSR